MELPRVEVHGAPPTGVGSQWPCPRGGGEPLPPAPQYVKNHVDSSWSRHIPDVLLHLTGQVQDEGAPFGNLNFVPCSSARAGRGSCSESLSRRCACRLHVCGVFCVVPAVLSSKAVRVLPFRLVA
jgi:hypothetical protein